MPLRPFRSIALLGITILSALALAPNVNAGPVWSADDFVTSWLNMVERFFRDITTQRLRNGVFRSVPELTTAIKEYIAVHNQNPKPFVWTAKAHDILAKVIRANRNLSSKQNEALH